VIAAIGSYSISTSSDAWCELARLRDDGTIASPTYAPCRPRRVILDVAAWHEENLEERIRERRDLFAGQRPVDARRRLGLETSREVMCACAYGERTKWM